MDHSDTIGALAKITDEGLFERLATAVLRQANPTLYGIFSHPGMNPAGKTRRSPVDAIGFVTSENPPHMVTAHHTTALLKDLKSKWLNDPSKVKKRRLKPSAPAGDVIKTSLIVEKERKRTPNLKVTLALTTNLEPSEDLIRDVQAAANLHEINIDVWSGSRIAHYLDNTPDGQWLRRKYLGITQEKISADLLAELSRRSLEAFNLMPSPESLVEREFDEIVARRSPLPLAFYVGESGFGKTIACYRFLKKHIDSGGCGLVLSHHTLSAWQTLDQALDAELRKLHPDLELFAGGKARALCSPDQPLVVMVEDINWSDSPSLLLERLTSWASSESNAVARFNWRVLCPVWPRTIATTSAEARKRIDQLSVTVPSFTDKESRHAVKHRARQARVKINELTAGRISEALGNDPLLIGLYDFSGERQPLKVIETFVGNSIQRLGAGNSSFISTEYKEALRHVVREMLVRRQIDPTWRDIREWLREEPDQLAAMRQIIQAGDIVRLVVSDQVERLRFRHDRVRAWLLSDVMAELMRANLAHDSTIAEPFFADVIGSALARLNIQVEMVERVRRLNPLALFYGLKTLGEPHSKMHKVIVEAIYSWLQEEATHKRGGRSLRWAALQILAETESSHVIPISEYFNDDTWSRTRARFLNGDVNAGIKLCFRFSPGSNAVWLEREIEHAWHAFGNSLTSQVNALLNHQKTDEATRIGGLRLAGHLADPSLAKAIRRCWLNDKKRKQHLDEYLWAAAQCGGNKPAKLLGPICTVWAKLSNRRSDYGLAPREALGAHELSWSFRKKLTTAATSYFVSRARRKDLRDPIMWMLRGVNQPEAVAFIVRVFAQHSRSGHGYSTLPGDEEREWERSQFELGRPMSIESRQQLFKMWKARNNDKHIRRTAFRLWAATIAEGDLAVLREADDQQLSDLVLSARIKRGDMTAVPALIIKLRGDHAEYWWHLGHYFWSEALSSALEEELCQRDRMVPREWNSSYRSDWIISELLSKLPAAQAEDLIQRHWQHLRFSPYFVQAALLIATPTTCYLARKAVSACSDPASIFKFASMYLHPQLKGERGLNRLEQAQAYLPYLEYLDEFAIYNLWDTCNRLGWFSFRRLHIDTKLAETRRDRTLLDERKFFGNLDDILQRTGADWADFVIDRYLEQTDRVEDILVLLEKWLKERRTIEAFDFVAAVLRHVGRRSDLELLIDGIQPAEEVEEIRRDTFFAVARRSLN